jgi:hypothetical protein
VARQRPSPDHDEETGFTVSELILAFWEHAERHYQTNGEPTSELSCFKSALGPVRKEYGHTQAANFGPLDLRACRQTISSGGMVPMGRKRFVPFLFIPTAGESVACPRPGRFTACRTFSPSAGALTFPFGIRDNISEEISPR